MQRAKRATGVPLTSRERAQQTEQRRLAAEQRRLQTSAEWRARIDRLRAIVPLTEREASQRREQRLLAAEHRRLTQSIRWRAKVDAARATPPKPAPKATPVLPLIDLESYAAARRVERERYIARLEHIERAQRATAEELDELVDEYADNYGVPIEVAESLVEAEASDSVEDYVESLYERLEELGHDVDLSDLYDCYYGYSPGTHGR